MAVIAIASMTLSFSHFLPNPPTFHNISSHHLHPTLLHNSLIRNNRISPLIDPGLGASKALLSLTSKKLFKTGGWAGTPCDCFSELPSCNFFAVDYAPYLGKWVRHFSVSTREQTSSICSDQNHSRRFDMSRSTSTQFLKLGYSRIPPFSLSSIAPVRSGRLSEQHASISCAGSRNHADSSLSVNSQRLEDTESNSANGEMEMNAINYTQICNKSNSMDDSDGPAIAEGRKGSVECIGTGSDVDCIVIHNETESLLGAKVPAGALGAQQEGFFASVSGTLLLVSPFFFWGTAMVVMKQVLPKAGPFFVAATRLIPAGALVIAFGVLRGRKQPSGLFAWISILAFGLIDASCFQGFLAEGLKRTSAGLGSVIIDSQPLTVAVLAAILFGETIGTLGALGLVTGIIGLLLLEVPPEALESLLTREGFGHTVSSIDAHNNVRFEGTWSIWESGEWWMLLAAQSMAIGTVMFRWVCQYSDPIMATGWHMILGGVPLLVLSAIQHGPALNGHFQDLDINDWLSLLYTSVFGSAISYGVFFYNATTGSLTRLSSLTFLTPMFAALFGYFFLGEVLSPLQLLGATVTLSSIYLVNAKSGASSKELDERGS